METEKAKAHRVKLEASAKAAKDAYDKEKATFDRKWVKKVQDHQILVSDDE